MKTKHLNNYDLFHEGPPPAGEPKRAKKQAPKGPAMPDMRDERPVYIGQVLHIRPSYIVSLPEYFGGSKGKSLEFMANQANLLQKNHKGILSSKAINKLKNAINWLLCAAEEKNVYHKKHNSWFKFKVNFITLTLPDTATVITNSFLQKALLNPFLTYLRSYHGLKNYVWKLEFQKNGKLHVHFISDVFIHHTKIRKAWNSILAKNKCLIDFSKKFGHCNPNSTDIHSVRKIKNLGAYLVKYMSKQDAALAKIKGRIWGCNRELSAANKTKLFIDRDSCATEMRQLMSSDIEFKEIESEHPVTKMKRKFGEIFFVKYTDWITSLSGKIKETFDDTILFLKNVAATKEQLLTV